MSLAEVVLTDSNSDSKSNTMRFRLDEVRLRRKGEFFKTLLARWSAERSPVEVHLEVPEPQHQALRKFLCGIYVSDAEVFSLADTADAYCLDPLLERLADLRTTRFACLNCKLCFVGKVSAKGPCQPLTPSSGDSGVRCGLCRGSMASGCECRMPELPEHALGAC